MKIVILSVAVLSWITAQNVFADCVTESGHLASPSKEVVKKSAEYAASRDFQAFQALLDSGRAFILKGGMKVHVVDRSFGMVKIRPHGQTAEAWAQSNAVNCR